MHLGNIAKLETKKILIRNSYTKPECYPPADCLQMYTAMGAFHHLALALSPDLS